VTRLHTRIYCLCSVLMCNRCHISYGGPFWTCEILIVPKCWINMLVIPVEFVGSVIIKSISLLVGFEVLTVVVKSTIFWDITPCSPLNVNRRFGETYRLHFQGRRISWARNQRESPLLWSTYSSTLKMEAICSSETSADIQRTTRRYIPQDGILISFLNIFCALWVATITLDGSSGVRTYPKVIIFILIFSKIQCTEIYFIEPTTQTKVYNKSTPSFMCADRKVKSKWSSVTEGDK
jgi:hypothetical protein